MYSGYNYIVKPNVSTFVYILNIICHIYINITNTMYI